MTSHVRRANDGGSSPPITHLVRASSPEDVAAELSKTGTKKQREEIPIFLQKTFHMINSCNPEIACWSDDGDTFVVKDPEALASTVFPQYFKHNKFSSFVRQLNFYGFKKVKHLPLVNVQSDEEDVEMKYWRFRHDYFKKDRWDLLPNIKKAMQSSTSVDPKEVEMLRMGMARLEAQVVSMSAEMESLRDLVHTLVHTASIEKKRVDKLCQSQLAETGTYETRNEWDQRKRKRVSEDYGMSPEDISSEYIDPIHPKEIISGQDQNEFRPPSNQDSMSMAPMLEEPSSISSLTNPADGNDELEPFHPGMIVPLTQTTPYRMESFGSASFISSCEKEILGNLFLSDDTSPDEMEEKESHTAAPSQTMTSNVDNKAVGNDETPRLQDEEAMKKVRVALSILPKKLQDAFADRLLATLQDPQNFQLHSKAISDLATAAAQKATIETQGGADVPNVSPRSISLAAATLDAYLREYVVCGSNNELDTCKDSFDSQGLPPSLVPL